MNGVSYSLRFKIVLFSIALSFPFSSINGTSASFAKTIWCNPENVGFADGNSKLSGYMTLHKVLTVMSPGDEVIIANGDWREVPDMFIDAKHKPPDGTKLNYSKVLAETDWNVKLPYISIETAKDKTQGYMEFRGIVFDNKYIGQGKGHISYHMHHTKFIRCGFLAHGLKGNSHTCGFGSAESSRSKNQYNLMEECIAWGSGRYVFYCKYGKYNIFRRCVARHDRNTAPQMFNFRAYACDYTVAQNCISIDSDRKENYANPINVETGGFWFGDQYGAEGNLIDGCISFKDMQIAYYVAGNGKNTGSAAVKNCVALDLSYNLPKVTTLCALVLAQDENVTISNVTAIGAKFEGQDGIYCKKRGKKTIKNCILANIADEGIGINPSSESVTIHNNVFYNVGGGKYGEGRVKINPFENGLRYPVRIEKDSELTRHGINGTICGATTLKKIGLSGTLYGEPGWDKVTDENLWPFPNEKKIKELMRETVEGVPGIYGFCSDGQTLTNYIWGYFGNVPPPFNVRAIPGDRVVTLTWDVPAEIVLETITGFNVYEVKNGAKTLMGGTVTGNQTYSKTISGLVSGRQYEFAVTSIDKGKGESGLSYTVKVIPKRIEELAPKKTVSDKTARTEKKVDDSADPSVKALPVGTEKKNDDAVRVEAPPEKKITNRLGMKFVLISPGTFEMGLLSDGQNQANRAVPHRVVLTKGFYMQTTEVTQGQWKKVMETNPSYFADCGDDCPVEQVSWNEVQQFIEKLNRLEGTDKYRLPTEAEWEYACRAGTKTPFSSGVCLKSDDGNSDAETPFPGCERALSREMTIKAGSLAANLWGLYDMHGNVWEWCQDWFGPYPDGPVTDPKGPPSGKFRVFRGGGWNSYPKACRSGNRSGAEPNKCFANLGFRLVKKP